MPKPSITKRVTKGAALTYNELDTNFQNLADATVSLTAGTGGTQVTSDLNGNITLVAGTGITLTGNNTAKTITITNASLGANAFGKIVVAGQSDVDADSTSDTLTLAAGSNISITTNASTDTVTIASTVTGLTNPLTSDLNTSTYKITRGSNSNLTLEGVAVVIQNFAAPTTDYIGIGVPTTTGGLFNIDCSPDRDLTIRTYESSSVSSFITLTSGAGISLSTDDIIDPVLISKGLMRLVPMTTAQRNTITAQQGMVIFNSTDSKMQVYDGTNWVNLH